MGATGGAVRILHVDDEPDFAEMAATFLKRENDQFEVETATSVSEGLDRLATADFECVVSDYDMPGQNGIEFLRTLRESYPDLPFILYTGKGSEKVASEAISAGVTGYLQKERGTDQFTVLANRITNAVEHYRSQHALAQRNQELERTNTVLSMLFDTLPVGVLTEDADRNVLAVNERMFDLFEMPGSPDEIVGADCESIAKQVSEMFADSDGFVGRINDLLDEREPVDGEELVLQDGRIFGRSYRPIELQGRKGHLWVYRDITERKEREQELVQYKTYLEETSDVIAVVNPDGTVGFHSRHADDVDGFSPFNVEGESGFEYVHPDDREEMADLFATVLQEETKRVTAELRVETADDDWRWLEIHGVNKMDAPAIEGIIVSSRDITERKEHEQELRRTKRRMELALEETDSAVYESEAGSREVRTYPSPNPVFEYDITSIDQFLSHVHPEDRSLVKENAIGLDVGDSYDLEYRVQTEESVKWVHDYGKQIVTQEENKPLDIGNITDITEQKQRETELERQNKRLNEFASTMSHDIRNPLNVAQGRLALASEECESDHLDDVSKALTRINELIDDLLTLSRQGESIGESEALKLSGLVESCWRNVETSDATLNANVSTTIQADKSRVQQLLENLMRNAIEHGGEAVTITVGELPDGFYLADDGPGIPESERDEIFDPGYSQTREGTGFGLAIVQEITEAHGWEIDITESASGGARFEITGVEVEN